MNTCKQIVIESERDLFIDIEHELKYYLCNLTFRLVVFIWPNQLVNKIQNENMFLEELNKFRK